MASIGQQINAARKAKGMTQDALSKSLDISRSAMAHWETGRTIPDAEMLLKLSKALDYSFEDGTVKAAEPVPEADISPVKGEAFAPQANRAVSPQRTANPIKSRRIVLWATVAGLLCACLAGLVIHASRAKLVAYRDESGAVYTVEQFQRETPREDGKAWLSTEQVLTVQQGDGIDMWMYDFVFHEMNGVGLTINRLETYTFVGQSVHPQIINGDTLESFGLENVISPRGDWSFSGGLPVQEKVVGIGIVLACTDDNGESLSFTNFLKLNS